MSTQAVTIQVLGDASSFRRTIQDVQKMQGKLGNVSASYQKSGMAQNKTLQKITKTFNKQQVDAGKKALEHEKKLKDAIDKNIKSIRDKQKVFKGSAAAIEDEVKALKKLEKEYRKVHAFRKSTGVRSGSERMGGAAGAAGRGIGSGIGAVAGFGGMLVAGLAAAALRSMFSHVGQSYSSYSNFGRASASLSGTGIGIGDMFSQYSEDGLFGRARMYKLRDNMKHSQRLGYSATETIQQMAGVARATGGSGDLIGRTQQAQTYARMYGGDVGEVSGFMGTLTQARGESNKREMSRMMQHAMTAGMDKSRAGEAMAVISSQIAGAASVSGGKVDASSISAMVAWLGRGGNPALQGARGANIMSAFDSAIKGAGSVSVNQEAAKAMMFQSFGYGNATGDRTSYFDAIRRSQQGVFGKGGAENLLDMMAGVERTTGGGQQASYALSGMTGLSMDAIDAMRSRVAQGGPREQILSDLNKIMKEEAPTDVQTLDTMKESLKLATRAAEIDNELVEHGMSSAEYLEDIQDDMRRLVASLMPTAINILEAIRDSIVWVKESLDFFTGYDPNEAATEMAGINANETALSLSDLSRRASKGLSMADLQEELPELAAEASRNLENAQNLRRGSPQELYARREAMARAYGQQQQVTTTGMLSNLPGMSAARAVSLGRVAGLQEELRRAPLDTTAHGRERGMQILGDLRRELVRSTFDEITGRMPTGAELMQIMRAQPVVKTSINPDDPAAYRAAVSAYVESSFAQGRVDGGN